MNAELYHLDIIRATQAADLHAMTENIKRDGQLYPEEKHKLLDLIAKKFSQWNAAALGPQTPRW